MGGRLVEDEESADPIGEEVRSILDGHLVLSRKLASVNHYPAIDLLHSVSRVMDRIVKNEHRQAAVMARQLLAKHRDLSRVWMRSVTAASEQSRVARGQA